MEPIEIKLADLKILFGLFLSALEQEYTNGTLNLDKDYYWSIDDEVLFDVFQEQNPTLSNIGQISEDLYFIRESLPAYLSNENVLDPITFRKFTYVLRGICNKGWNGMSCD